MNIFGNIQSRIVIRVWIVQIVIVVAFLAFWEIGSRIGFINSFIFSSPSKIVGTIVTLFKNGELLGHMWVTLQEIISAFSLGIGIAFVVSVIFC